MTAGNSLLSPSITFKLHGSHRAAQARAELGQSQFDTESQACIQTFTCCPHRMIQHRSDSQAMAVRDPISSSLPRFTSWLHKLCHMLMLHPPEGELRWCQTSATALGPGQALTHASCSAPAGHSPESQGWTAHWSIGRSFHGQPEPVLLAQAGRETGKLQSKYFIQFSPKSARKRNSRLKGQDVKLYKDALDMDPSLP